MIALVAVAVVAGVIAAAVAQRGDGFDDGPLRGFEGTGFTYNEQPPGAIIYWGWQVFDNFGGSDVILESVELWQSDHPIEVAGPLRVALPTRMEELDHGAFDVKPAADVEYPERFLVPVEGLHILPRTAPNEAGYELIVPLRMPADRATIWGVTVTYSYAGKTYKERYLSTIIACPPGDPWGEPPTF